MAVTLAVPASGLTRPWQVRNSTAEITQVIEARVNALTFMRTFFHCGETGIIIIRLGKRKNNLYQLKNIEWYRLTTAVWPGEQE
ncbi:MAG: hypothetical protein JW699_02200 [Chitinispirillaceae bacterium]|nr:hypothetical protein [Chitinispirillaceae bacterium]